MVTELLELHLGKFVASGAELVIGEARFTGPKIVRVTLNAGGTRLLCGERVFINVGTRARVPDVPGLVIAAPMTHVEALNLERSPRHSRRRLRWPGIRPGDAAVRQPRHDRPARPATPETN